MDRETRIAMAEAADRVCTNFMLTLETMWEIEGAGMVDQKVLDKLSFAMNVVLTLRSHLDDEFESLISDEN